MVNLISSCLWKALWNLQCETSKGDEYSIQHLVQELLFCILKSKMSGFLSMCRTPKRTRNAMVRHCIVALICGEMCDLDLHFGYNLSGSKRFCEFFILNDTSLDRNCLTWQE